MTKNFAYIIGVFLGDGSIASDKRTFTLQAIDEDFVDKTVACLSTLSENKVRKVIANRLTTANKIVYAMYLSDVKFCNELQEITNKRKNIPIDFEKWDDIMKKELISGLLDSEGYVSMYRKHEYNGQEVFSMSIGIGACDLWLYELYNFLKRNGYKVGEITREILKSGKIFSKFSFNKKDFIEKELYFNIKRKQNRIEKYKSLFPGSTTIRCIPRTDFTKQLMSDFAKTRKRVGGKFIKIEG